MGRPGCGITHSAVEAQAQAMISQPQRGTQIIRLRRSAELPG